MVWQWKYEAECIFFGWLDRIAFINVLENKFAWNHMLFIIFHAQFFSPYQMVYAAFASQHKLSFFRRFAWNQILKLKCISLAIVYTSKQSRAKENVKAFQTDERQWAVADLRMHLHMFLDEPIETQFTAKMETARTFVCDVRLKWTLCHVHQSTKFAVCVVFHYTEFQLNCSSFVSFILKCF